MGIIMKNGVAYGAGITPITIEGTLVANATSIAFTNDAILEGERYNVYAWNKPTVKPTNMVVSGHTLTLTYPAQSTDTRIKVVINENVNTISDKSQIVTTFPVEITGWSSDTTSQSGVTLYKKQISVSDVWVNVPDVDIGSSSGNVLPTSAEQESYNLLQYVTCDDSVPCLYLYASAIPTTAFYINVEGVD